jgi:hypothetical protein
MKFHNGVSQRRERKKFVEFARNREYYNKLKKKRRNQKKQR